MKFFKFWFPVIVYSAIIFYVSSLPNLEVPLKDFSFDKALHLGEYMVLGFLFTRAFTHLKFPIDNKIAYLAVILFSFFYGLSDEFHQSFVAGRFADPMDLLMDMVGGLIGGWIFLRYVNNPVSTEK